MEPCWLMSLAKWVSMALLLADSGALLKEIPGGCMCCVNGLPMQVGIPCCASRETGSSAD